MKSVPVLEETQEIQFVGNPFVAGPRVKPSLFTGRQKAIKTIVQHVAAAELQSRSIVANRRMGKTSLLTYIHKAYAKLMPSSYAQWAAVYIDLQEAGVQTQAGFMRAVRLSLQRDLPEEMHEFLWKEARDGHLQSLQESIKEVRKQGAAIILLLDEWEEVQAHTDLNTTIDSLRTLVNHGNLSLITSSAIELSRLHQVSEVLMANAGKNPADTSKLYPLLPTTYLGLMSKEEWQYVVTSAFDRCQRDIRTSDLRLIESLAGGNPILTQMAGSILWESLDEGWNEGEMRQIFAERAEQTFRDWWNKEYVDVQQEALRHVLGLPFSHDPAPSTNELNNAITQLKLRGLLDDQGNIFAQPFTDFIHRLHQ